MTLKQFILVMTFATALCWAGVFSIVFYINPFDAGAVMFMFFYITFFLSLVGIFSLMGLGVRAKINTTDPAFKLVIVSYRQAIFFASLIVGTLLLQSRRLLTWWNIIILFSSVIFLELFFISQKKDNRNL